MKSTKYQLLKCEYDHLKNIYAECRKLKDEYENTLREIDTHVRATPDPTPYIVETLKKVMPEYQ